MSTIKPQKTIPQVFQEITHDLLKEVRKPEPWGRALRQFEKQQSAVGIKCPVCREPSLNFWYYPHSSESANRKWNRFGDAWVNCQNCGVGSEFHGLKIPDWYIAPSDKCTTCGKELEAEEDKITAFCSDRCRKLHLVEYRKWRIVHFIFHDLVYIFLFVGGVGMVIIDPYFPTLNLGSWPHLIFFWGIVLWFVRSSLPIFKKAK